MMMMVVVIAVVLRGGYDDVEDDANGYNDEDYRFLCINLLWKEK